MIYFERGSETCNLTEQDLQDGLYTALDKIPRTKKVLIIPPDITRKHSRAGLLTAAASRYYGKNLKAIMPALGTHEPMPAAELTEMFPGVDQSLFRIHNWKKDLVTLGRVPAEYIESVSNGKLTFDWPAQVNKTIPQDGWDLILSIGQVVPHEVIGFANHSKNIFIGTGGAEGIHKSHYLGAICGLENIMGKINTPVRKVLNYASEHFLNNIPILYILTVIGPDDTGADKVRGLFIGDGLECFTKAAELSRKVNIRILDKPLQRAVVYLDPAMYRSTWLGNKAIYRTRLAMADNGELIIIAPGIREFGEDPSIDKIIRTYGYSGTEKILTAVRENEDIRSNLCAAAHLIHGSSEGRFSITYSCGALSGEEIRRAGYRSTELKEAELLYKPDSAAEGLQINMNGEEFYFIKNPALGLWAYKEKFQEEINV